MQICVKTLMGKDLSIDIDESVDSCTILMIKEALEEKAEASAGQMRLVYMGKAFEDSKTLADYSIDRAIARGELRDCNCRHSRRCHPCCNPILSLMVAFAPQAVPRSHCR